MSDGALTLPMLQGKESTEDSTTAGPTPPAQPLFELQVYGTPAPQGSKRVLPAGGRPGGRPIVVESSKAVLPWRNAVVTAARVAIGDLRTTTRFPMDGPLRAQMVFTLRKPMSAPKTRRTYPDRTPDLSKLLRSTEDALKDAGVIADDARIVRYIDTAKVFPNEDVDALPVPGALIRIWPVT